MNQQIVNLLRIREQKKILSILNNIANRKVFALTLSIDTFDSHGEPELIELSFAAPYQDTNKIHTLPEKELSFFLGSLITFFEKENENLNESTFRDRN